MDRKEHIDPHLRELLERLRPTPERNAGAINKGRNRFMAELNEMFPSRSTLGATNMSASLPAISKLSEGLNALFSSQIVFTTLTLILLVLVFLFGGANMSAAAHAALPGDALYPLKTGIEQTRLSVTNDPARQAELYLEFASRRLAEMSALVESGRYNNIDSLSSEFVNSIHKALAVVQLVATSNPEHASELNSLIADMLAKYTGTLNDLLKNVPDTAKSDLQRAIDASPELLEELPDNESENLTNGPYEVDPETGVSASSDEETEKADSAEGAEDEKHLNGGQGEPETPAEGEDCKDENGDGLDDVNSQPCHSDRSDPEGEDVEVDKDDDDGDNFEDYEDGGDNGDEESSEEEQEAHSDTGERDQKDHSEDPEDHEDYP